MRGQFMTRAAREEIQASAEEKEEAQEVGFHHIPFVTLEVITQYPVALFHW